ncbi:MAG: insulinase family protein [Proteobacteria bacterium]|nr:insulinase family protein [Pseudomonadota bacterium]
MPVAAALGAGEVKLPAYQLATLPNGAVVALVEKRDTPLVSMNLTVRGGGLGDQAGRDGTASLFTDLIQKGAGNRTAAQFAEAIENAGGSLSAGAGTESIGVNASFMSRDVDLMLELVADVLQRPRLDAAEFEKARTLAMQSILAAKDSDPRALMSSYGDAWLFRGHPYGRTVSGSEASLAAGTLDDIKRFYAEQVGGDRLIITVVGDFDSATMLRQLERSFGTWRRAGSSVAVAPPPAKVTGRQVLLIDKPGATQTYFWLGNVGASRTDPARTAQSVVNTVFGGRFTSMLNTELRVKSGLTYGARAAFDRGSQPGAFSITSYTETSKTAQAIDMALDTLARLHKDGLDAGQLQSSQSYMLGQFPPSIETNGQIAARLADLLLYGLGPEDVNEYAQRVSQVDAAAVRSTIEQSFPRPENIALVLIGDAAKIRDVVKKYGPVTEMKITDPRFTPATK